MVDHIKMNGINTITQTINNQNGITENENQNITI